MVFSSIPFLFYFLPLFSLAYVLSGSNLVILLFSLAFYAFGEGAYVAVMLGSIAVNHAVGLWVGEAKGRARRFRLAVGIAFNLGLLGSFKYLGFLAHDVLPIPRGEIDLSLHLPIGISFFTFQAMSYLIDVYRRQVPAERSLLNVGLYISMFPQLVAGPIVRFASVAQAIHRRQVGFAAVYAGTMLFAVGLAQKVLIADVMATLADPVFAEPAATMGTIRAWEGVGAYTLQIYFDFAGYSNMAIGLGLTMGFRFPLNFNYPYISRSVTEFWRRWHMSLSSWFRDYLYIPLGGNRHGALATCRNLLIVFLLCGLWHGAAWTFVLWGLFHGAALLVERAGLRHVLDRLPGPVAAAYTLLLVMVGWTLFRADTIGEAGEMLRAMAVFRPSGESAWDNVDNAVLLTAAIGVLAATPWPARLARRFILLPRITDPEPGAGGTPLAYALGLIFATVLIVACSIQVLAGAYSPFIYFRF